MDNFVQLGFQLPLIITFWTFIGLLVLSVLLFVVSGGDDFSGAFFAGGFALLFSLIALLIWVILLVPFNAKYHHIYRVSGEVTAVSNVLTESGGDLTRTPVITLEGVDRDITMEDPRSVNLLGKHVDLTCSIGWNYQSADTYDCKIYAIK